jgi:hypothetical protein
LSRPTARTALAALASSVLLAGCALWPSGGDDGLPDLPFATVVAQRDKALDFHGFRVRVVDIREAAEVPAVTLLVERGKDARRLTLPFEKYVGEGDLLFHATPHAQGATASGRPSGLVRLVVYHQPSMRAEAARQGLASARSLRPGDLLFLPGGFVAVERILDNDPIRRDDDRVRLAVSLKGVQEEVTLTEWHSRRVGDLTIAARDILAGESPGDPRATASLQLSLDGSSPWGEPEAAERLAFPPANGWSGLGLSLQAEVVPSEDQPRALLTLVSRQPPANRETFLRPGGSIRWNRFLITLDDASEAEVRGTVALFPNPVTPSEQRWANEAPPAAAGAPGDVATRVTRTLRQNETTEFWGATFRLRQVFDNERTDLMDDAALLAFEGAGPTDVQNVREGNRYTFRGPNRWWIVDVREAHPARGQTLGYAVLAIETGTFKGVD